MKSLLLIPAAMLCAFCAPPKSAEPGASDKLGRGEVAKIAEAPDGTVLWAVDAGSRRVYFASSGAQWSTVQSCGRNCTRRVNHDTPTAEEGL